jgi:adenine phosphoribosyltransferase
LNIDAKDWMKTILHCDRINMIKEALTAVDINNDLKKQVLKAYKSYPDFPKPGVIFQDIFAVLAHKDALNSLSIIMREEYESEKIDYVVGLESRGFFGVLLAKELKVGFIPIRKKGKLPGQVVRVDYGTEYSQDTCEISTDIPPNSRVLVFDDLIATGGSLLASVTLLNKVKCYVVDCCVLREVVSLREQAIKTMNGQSYTVLLQE